MSAGADDETRHDRPSRPSLKQPKPPPDFGPRYRVIETIGKGGMGEVYRAYDTELKGEVALKIVRSDADTDAALERFRREVALARKITSPNVLRVYDLAEHAGMQFLSMEYVDGEDLAKVMRREKLPLARALALFRQLCAGLEAAHAQGVVHRDLKPQNVLVDKADRVRVADFGLARSIAEAGLTATGEVLGSPAYMSPEQVKGEPTDARSDIYSLGVILYQLVTGKPPFQGDTPHAVMEMRLHKTPESVSEASPGAPAYVEAIIRRCLQIHRDARYASVHDIVVDLDATRAPVVPAPRRRAWLLGGLVAAIALVGAGIAVVAWPKSSEPSAAPSSTPLPPVAEPAPGVPIAVLILGFENRTGDPVFDATLDMLLHGSLRRSPLLSPTTGARLRVLASELGKDVQVDEHMAAVLAARDHARVITVRGVIAARGVGFAISITAKDATGATVVSQTLEAANLTQVVPVTARLGGALREALGEQLADAERAQAGLSQQLEADHEYALGWAALDVNDIDGAIAHLERAAALDPEFAIAHAVLSIAYSNGAREVDAEEQEKLALKWVDRMGERDRHKFLGDYYYTVPEDYARSISEFEQLLAKWPDDQGGLTDLAISYHASGDSAKALEYGLKAARLHPRSVVARANVPVYEILTGDYPRAVADLEKLHADFPRTPHATYEYLGLAHLLSGHRDEALSAFAKYTEIDPADGPAAQADMAIGEGRLADATALLEKGLADDKQKGNAEAAEVKAAMLAEARLRRGDKAGARAAAALVAKEPPRVLAAALVQLSAGDDKRALATAARMAGDMTPSRRAIGMMIEGEALRVQGKPKDAMVKLQEALHVRDLVYGHFLLGRAALDAKQFPEAYSELRTCVTRRSEVPLSPDDTTGYRYLPPFTYYLAKAQQGLGSPDAKASYQAFLAMLHDPDADDPLAADAKRQLAK